MPAGLPARLLGCCVCLATCQRLGSAGSPLTSSPSLLCLLCLLSLLHPQVDTAELEDARWFHADFLTAAISNSMPAVVRSGAAAPEFRIPGKYALASRIICSWLLERQQQRRKQQGEEQGEEEAAAALAAVPDVSIDEGSFKYVLLRLSTPDGEPPGMIPELLKQQPQLE